MSKDIFRQQLERALNNMTNQFNRNSILPVKLMNPEPESSELFSKAVSCLRQKDMAGARKHLDDFVNLMNALKPGDIVSFGHYLMPAMMEPNPDEIILPIDWIVLAREGSKLLLLSTNILARSDMGGSEWATSELGEYMNEDLMDRWFLQEEQVLIAPTHVDTKPNPVYPDHACRDTFDHVFLLSVQEFIRYLSPMKVEEIPDHMVDEYLLDPKTPDETVTIIYGGFDEDEDNRIGIEEHKVDWWFRTMGSEEYQFAVYRNDGLIDMDGMNCGCDEIGIRPAMWIDLAMIPALLK